MPDQIVIKERVPDRVVISEVGPQGIQGPNAIDLLTDTDVAGSVPGDLFGLLVSGKWGSITNVADLLRVDDAADTYVPLAALGSANGVATLDAAGKLSGSQIPALSINDTFVAADEAAMLALVAQRGDVAVRTDLSATFILSGDDPAVLGNWIKLLTPPDAVLSVNGKAGVVQIDAPDVPFVSTSDLVSDDVAAAIEEVHADPRLTNSRPPSGAAGGVLAGTYPNPGFAPSPSFVPSSAGAVGLLVIGQTAQTGDYFTAQDSLANTLAQITYLGGFRGARFSSVATGKASLESNYDTGGLAVLTGANANKGLVIRRNSATQTANLFEIQDESGVAMFRHDSGLGIAMGGAIVLSSASSTPGANAKLYVSSGSNPNVKIEPTNPASIPLIAKGAASQSADLQQWQDSTGAVIAQVASDGSVRSAQFFGSTVASKAKLFPNADTGGMLLVTSADANKGLVIRRNSAAQQANLQEWQSDGGGVNLSVDLSGRISRGATSQSSASLYMAPGSTSTVGVIFRGLASQTGNIQEWQDSSGAVLARIVSNGALSGAAGSANLQPGGDTGGFQLKTANDANKGLVIRRNSATQSANLFEIQAEGGGVLAGLDLYGRVFANQGGALSGATVSAVPRLTSDIGVIVRGNASQSGDLQQWQDSTGASLLRIRSDGTIAPVSGTFLVMAQDTGAATFRPQADTHKGIVVRRFSATQSADLLQTQNESGTPQISLMGNTSPKIYMTSATYGFHYNDGTAATAGRLVVYSDGAPNVLGIMRGAASQSGDLQQWQDSTGAAQATVSPAGNIFSSAGFSSSGTFQAGSAVGSYLRMNQDTGGMVVFTRSDANKGLVIRRNSATQTANLFEVQDDTGGARFVIGSDGTFAQTATAANKFNSIGGSGVTNYNLIIYSGAATSLPLVARGFASQSGDLLQLQDSSAATLVRFNSAGRLSINTALTTAMVNLGATSAGVPLMILKGQSGQTADLVQYDDVNAVTLTKVGATGGITSYGVTHTFDNLALPSGVAASLSATASTLVVGTPYFYVVTATNAAGETIASSEVTATPTAPNPSIQVSWSQVPGATGYKVYRSTVSGTYTTPSLVATQTNGVSTVFTDSGTVATAGAPTTPTGTKLILKQWAGQSANRLEFQTNSGAVDAFIDGSARMGLRTASIFSLATLSVLTTGVSGPGIVVKGVPSQSADLQQWQDSTGAVVGLINAAGNIAASTFGSTAASKAVLRTNFDTGGLGITTGADANKGLVIRRNSATVGANLFEIQDEAGSGKFVIQASMRTIVMGASAITDSGGGIGALSVYAPSPTAANMVLKAQPSQSANMTEWQSSASAVLAKVDSAGQVLATVIGSINNRGNLAEEASGARMSLTKMTAQATTPATNVGRIYFRDGTTAGTLKLVALGPGGVETTIVDNIA